MRHLFEKLPTLEERVAITYQCEIDPEFRQEVLEHASNNLVWFIHTFCWTFYPWDDEPDKPFRLWDFQVEYLNEIETCYREQRDLLTEKAREMGATWIVGAWAVWHWLFDKAFLCRIGSKKEADVDTGTIDGIFGKLRYLLNTLPGWMLPNGLDPDKHFTHMRITRPDRKNNVISGESSNQNFARSGRFHAVLFDELGFWPDIKASWTSAGQSTRFRLGLSTPNFKNEWWRMIDSGMYRVFRIEWWMHPQKDAAWLAAERKRYTDETDFNREILISYQSGQSGSVYSYVPRIPTGSYPYEKGMGLYTSWDFGLDETSIIWWGENPKTGLIRMVDSYSNSNQPIEFYVPLLLGTYPKDWEEEFGSDYGYDERDMVNRHRTWPVPINFGDPSGRQRNVVTGTSVLDKLMEHGIPVYTAPGSNTFPDRKTATDEGLRDLEGINLPNCQRVVDALRESRYPPRNEDGNYTTPLRNPVHNWTSHFRTAAEYFFVNYRPVMNYKNRPQSYRRKRAYSQI